MQTLTVDPGMNTGWALWGDSNLLKYGQFMQKHLALEEDLKNLFNNFKNLIQETKPHRVYLEYPGVWQNSYVSMAAVNSGDLLKLAAIVGGYASLSNCSVHFISPNTWKGQLSKDAVKFRVNRSTGISEKSSHINDAIGIGLFIFKKLNQINQSKPFQL